MLLSIKLTKLGNSKALDFENQAEIGFKHKSNKEPTSTKGSHQRGAAITQSLFVEFTVSRALVRTVPVPEPRASCSRVKRVMVI
jgi:hypothetical protein